MTLNPNGTFSDTPAAGFVGSDSFTYKVNDGLMDSPIATVSINVTNETPFAVNDEYFTQPGNSVSGTVVANDWDMDGDLLIFELLSQPANGTLSIGSGGSFIYTPNAEFVDLRSTLKERDMLKRLWKNFQDYTGPRATRAALLSPELKAPPILHIATHGFHRQRLLVCWH